MRKFMTFFFSAILAVSTFVTPAKAESADTYAVTFGATVTDAGQYVDRMTIDFGDVLSVAGITEETFEVHMTSTVDYGSLKGQPYPYYNAAAALPVVKTEVEGPVVTVYFNQATAGTLTWLGEGRNYPAILGFTVEQKAPITATTRDGRELEINGTYVCAATSYKDLECDEVSKFEDIQDEINYQLYKGSNDTLIVWFHG
ncbi:MAG: hypothetical protein IKD69_06855, partial [Solobacterium sp.]|nr:hypothetical protein [Solobacterium sp.]